MVRYRAACAVALALAAAAFCGAWAQAPPAPLKVAVVDIDQVGAKFERKIQAEKDLAAWYDQEREFLNRLSNLAFLTADEWTEVSRIYGVAEASWTPQQKDKEKALRDQSVQREKEYKELETKASRAPAEQERFAMLQNLLQGRDRDIKQKAAEADQELAKRQAELGQALMEPVQKVIEEIAQEKGYTLVLTKAVVFLGGEDITALVIERVNAAAKAHEGAGQPGGGTGEKPPAPEGGKPPGG
jgi:Skp family chaperone for outer membrane proteins